MDVFTFSIRLFEVMCVALIVARIVLYWVAEEEKRHRVQDQKDLSDTFAEVIDRQATNSRQIIADRDKERDAKYLQMVGERDKQYLRMYEELQVRLQQVQTQVKEIAN